MTTKELNTRSYPDDALCSGGIQRLGATPTADGTWFALWSARAARAAVRIVDLESGVRTSIPLIGRGDGVFAAMVSGVRAGALYELELDGKVVPDPYARFLPQGVHGPARVESPTQAAPRKTSPSRAQCILYEIHIGTFTPEGTFRAALTKLDSIAALGFTAIELMPLSAFSGSRGWGYDGVAHFAPHADYGEPDDLRALIAKAHELGLSVILDVVYNHFGPDGNYLSEYTRVLRPEFENELGGRAELQEQANA